MQRTAIARTASRPGWWGLLRDHARLHLSAALGLGLALLAVLALLVESVAQLAGGVAAPGLRLALLGGGVAFAATALGALPALVLRGLPQRVEDSLLGMAAGMMLAASAFSLLLPGLEAGVGDPRQQAPRRRRGGDRHGAGRAADARTRPVHAA